MTRSELRHGFAVAVPVFLVSMAIVMAYALGMPWTLTRIGFAVSLEAAACLVMVVLMRDRIVAGASGIDHHTWRGKTSVAWDDVQRFHCDGTRLVLIGGDGASLFELSEDAYGGAKPFIGAAVDHLRSRGILERRRDRLVMTAHQRHALDRVHRFWPLVFIGVGVAVVAGAGISAASVLAFLLLAGVGIGLVQLTARVVVTIGPDGITDHRWSSEKGIRWDDIASYRFSIDDTSWQLIDAGAVDDGASVLLVPLILAVNVAVVAFVFIGRALARTLVYGIRSDRFYRGRLTLLDAHGKSLYTLAARSGHADIEDAFDRILDELAERKVTFANGS